MADSFQIKLTKLDLGKNYRSSVLNSQGVQELLSGHAQRAVQIANSMGSATYDTDTQAGKNRAHALVWTPSLHAIYSNAKHNTLLKTLGSL